MPKRLGPPGGATEPRLKKHAPKVHHFQLELANSRKQPSGAALILLLAFLFAAIWPEPLSAQEPEKGTFDIAIIIENRVLPEARLDDDASDLEKVAEQKAVDSAIAAAKADIDLLFETLDRQMDFEHIVRFNRPTIDIICDVFGCPDRIEDVNPFPPLLWPITRGEEARLFFYYIGDGRLEGLERQLLFHRHESAAAQDVVGYPVEWLHQMLAEANASSTLVMLDTSFAPRPLPCVGEDPFLINDALVRVRQNYQRIAREHWNRTDSVELSATTPVQPPHCDRFDQILNELEQPLFTKFLLKGIVDREANADGDDVIELGELTSYLDDRLKRAARFQWGRLQNVRSVGALSFPVAVVQKRDFRPWNKETLERPEPRPEEEEQEEDTEKEEVKEEDKEEEKPAEKETDKQEPDSGPDATLFDPLDPCEADPDAPGCRHPCDIDATGQACDELCQENPSFPCPFIGAGPRNIPLRATRELDGGIIVEPVEEPNPPADGRSPLCQFAADKLAPFSNRLLENIIGANGPAATCAWTRGDQEIVFEGWWKILESTGYILRPVIWPFVKPLIMPVVKKTVGCALNCGGVATANNGDTNGQDDNLRQCDQPAGTNDSRMALADWEELMRRYTDRHLSICNAFYVKAKSSPIPFYDHRPKPFYIGIPRWMPGTWAISEGVRANLGGCPPPPPDPLIQDNRPGDDCGLEIEPPDITPSNCQARTPTTNGTFFSHRLDRLLHGWMIAGVLEDVEANGIDLPDSGSPKSPPMRPKSQTRPNDQICLPEVAPNIVLTTSQMRWLQSALTVDNWNPGPIDGSLGKRTIDALNAWRRVNQRPTRSTITENDFKSVMKTFGCRFGQVFPRVERFAKEEDKCPSPVQEPTP